MNFKLTGDGYKLLKKHGSINSPSWIPPMIDNAPNIRLLNH